MKRYCEYIESAVTPNICDCCGEGKKYTACPHQRLLEAYPIPNAGRLETENTRPCYEEPKNGKMTRAKMPPIGVKPRYLIDEERIVELKQAIERAMSANYPLRDEIVSEYNELVSHLEEE